MVLVHLVRVGDRGAVVAGVADAVAVAVGLVGVREPGAVVGAVARAVTVAVTGRSDAELAHDGDRLSVR